MTDHLPAWTRSSQQVVLAAGMDLEELSRDWAVGGADGAGVRVAVIDSGIDASHPALEGCVDAGSSVAVELHDGRPVLVPGPHTDAFGHGTACAGIIHGLAPRARIVSVKVLGEMLSGKAAQFHAGLAWAVEQGFDVINLSLGTKLQEWALPFHELCDRAYFAGSFVVTAANNVQRETYPSLFASVTSVACNTSRDPRRFHVNPDPPAEFLACGIDVEVPWLEHGSSMVTGNSYACPHIAGHAALVKSAHPMLRPFQVKAALCSMAANLRTGERPDLAGRLSRSMAALPLERRSMVTSRVGVISGPRPT